MSIFIFSFHDVFSRIFFILQLEVYSTRVYIFGISGKSDLHIEIKNLISIYSMKYLKNITCVCVHTCVFQVLSKLSLS